MKDPLGDDPAPHVEVAVHTPRGTWPTEGFFSAPAHQKVQLQLEHAARELNIKDRVGWEATAEGKRLNVEATFLESGLHGQIVIRYGPPGKERNTQGD